MYSQDKAEKLTCEWVVLTKCYCNIHQNESLMSIRNDHWTRRASLLSTFFKTTHTYWVDFTALCNMSERGGNSFSQLQMKPLCESPVRLSARFFLQW